MSERGGKRMKSQLWKWGLVVAVAAALPLLMLLFGYSYGILLCCLMAHGPKFFYRRPIACRCRNPQSLDPRGQFGLPCHVLCPLCCVIQDSKCCCPLFGNSGQAREFL